MGGAWGGVDDSWEGRLGIFFVEVLDFQEKSFESNSGGYQDH